jgi:hypothetical protein
MRIFLTEEALVADYWRKLTRCIGAPYKSRGRVGRDALQRPVGAAVPTLPAGAAHPIAFVFITCGLFV